MKFEKLQRRHRREVEKIARELKEFDDREVDVCLEIADTCIEDPAQREYYFDCALDESDRVIGFVSYGEASLAERVWEVYWIAVAAAGQGRGTGRKMLEHAEEKMKAARARMSLIETSGRPDYAATNRFYQRCGYTEAARVQDFYREGDDLVIYRKDFGSD